jgi:outer membrane protein
MQRVDTEANYILAAYQIKSLEGNLTAKSLKLPVKYFEPEKEFKKVKMRIIGD